MLNHFSKTFVNSLFALALTFSVAAYGQNGTEQKVSFYLDGKIGGEVVKKGTYTITIPEADQGNIEIKVGKKVVTAQFTKRQNNTSADADKMTYRDNGDGSNTVSSITPRGRKYTLVIGEAGSSVAKQ